MATFKAIEEIEAWQKARALTQEIYAASRGERFTRDFGLRDQIRRASVSVMANIAEGFERDGSGEFLQFLSIAKGSAGEVRAHLYVAFDQGYIDQATFKRLLELVMEVSRVIAGLMAYLRTSGIRGSKYRKPVLINN